MWKNSESTLFEKYKKIQGVYQKKKKKFQAITV